MTTNKKPVTLSEREMTVYFCLLLLRPTLGDGTLNILETAKEFGMRSRTLRRCLISLRAKGLIDIKIGIETVIFLSPLPGDDEARALEDAQLQEQLKILGIE